MNIHWIAGFINADFCKGADIINSKGHLTVEGLDQLELLAEGMNSTRTKFN
jgi:hypothetical protein